MNLIRNRRLSRRTVLRGTGAALALPLLEAMIPARASERRPAPLCTAFVFVPGGVNHDAWLPKDDGPNYTPSPTLKALDPVRKDVLVLSGLNGRRGETGANGHPLGTAPWLSSAKLNVKDRGGYCTDLSVDQILAGHVGKETRLPSLELGCDNDSRNMHESNISWRAPGSPMGKEFNPKDVYARLFADPKSDVYGIRILDAVREDAKRLSGRLGGIDREKLDEYFESVRSIERRIEAASRHQPKGEPPKLDLPAGVPAEFPEHAALLSDLLIAAFRTDATRVATFMVNNEPGRNRWTEIGIKENHHALAHLDPRTKEGKDKLAKLQRIDQAYLEMFVATLKKLAAIREGDGRLLDRCQILYGSPLTWGRLHNRENLPVLLAGGGRGAITGGRHLACGGRPFADLHLAMLSNGGVRRDALADATGPLPGLRV